MNTICPVVKRFDPRLWPLLVEYEQQTSEWLSKHPSATPDQVAKACREIADSLGI